MAIDPDFRKKSKKTSKEEGIAIWGFVNPPEKLSIRGTTAGVDWDICSGCGICLDVCPMHVYEWRETPGYPTSERKAFPAGERDCLQCLKCETQCQDQAINTTFLGPQWWWEQAMVYIMFLQIIGGIIYGAVFGPYWDLRILQYLGWVVLVVGLPFFFSPLIYFPKGASLRRRKTLCLPRLSLTKGLMALSDILKSWFA